MSYKLAVASANTEEFSMSNSTISMNRRRVVSHTTHNEPPSVPTVLLRNQLLNELADLDDRNAFSLTDVANAFSTLDTNCSHEDSSTDVDTVSTAPISDKDDF